MQRFFVAAALAAGLLLPGLAAAQGPAIAARAGTFGVGGEATLDVNRHLGFRAGLGFIPVQPTGSLGDVDYRIKPPSTLTNLGADVYPFGGHFRLSGGLLLQHDVTMEGKGTGTYEFNNVTYSASEAGAIDGRVDWGSTAPYATLGFSGRGKGLGLSLDLGAAFLGEPALELTSTGGTLSGNATFQQNLKAEQDRAQKDAGKYLKILPVLSLGLRFGI